MKNILNRLAVTTLTVVTAFFVPSPSALAASGLQIPTAAEQNTFAPRITEYVVPNPEVSLSMTVLANIPPGYTVTNATYPGWVADSILNNIGQIYLPVLYSSLDLAALNGAGIPTVGLDKVNYILNHKPPGAKALDIQDAILTVLKETGEAQGALRGGFYSTYFGFTPHNQAASDAIVADANANGGGFIPAPGQIVAVVLDVPASLNGVRGQRNIIEVVCPAGPQGGSIGDFVWKDLNSNGLQDAAEPGINGAQVSLLQNNVVIATATTAGNGGYLFTGLAAGNYVVSLDINQAVFAGSVPTTANAPGGDVNNDSNPNSTTVVLPTSTSTDTSIDFGFKPEPIAGSIGDFVWKDTNSNGLQDGAESGINGAQVTLLQNNVVIATATTAGNGGYLFTGLAAGTYVVSIDSNQAVFAGCVPTTVNAPGSDANSDSNANPTTVVLPTSNSTDTSVDFGFKPVSTDGSIGNFVWKDTNSNGVQDAGEPGINGAQVKLLQSNVVVATATTAGNGGYLFTGLAAGTYVVSIDSNQAVFAGCVPTTVSAPGSDANTDSNPNSATVVLPTHSSTDTSIDFGFKPAPTGCLFLVIDEDSIDNTTPAYYLVPNTGKPVNGRTWSSTDVNNDRSEKGRRTPLRFFNNPANFGRQIVIRSGQVGDEGLFAIKTIPASWVAAGPTTDGLRNFIGDPCLPLPHNVGNGLGRGNDSESRLDKNLKQIPNVTPLRAAGLRGLIGRTVCALVYDSDISINYGPLQGSLKGKTLGVVAFKVLEVTKAVGFSSSTLPLVTIEIVDPCQAFAGAQALYLTAPVPTSSSTPFDITP